MIDDSISSGAFYSPKPLISAIVKVINPSSLQSVYDPALGTGRFIIETEKYISGQINVDFEEKRIVAGSDISPFACLIGSVNLLLNGTNINRISLDDSLLNNDSKTYDLVLSGIPFGKVLSKEKYDYGYNGYTSSLESMFIKHTMRKLSIDGKAAIIVPDVVLFSGGKEIISLRRELLTEFNLHSILCLPGGTLGTYSGVKASVLFFDKSEPTEDVWFYSLLTEKKLGKIDKISEIDFVEFISDFSMRSESSNSWCIDKEVILDNENVSLFYENPAREKKEAELVISDEILDLKSSFGKQKALLDGFEETLSSLENAKHIRKVKIADIFTTTAGKVLSKKHIKQEGKYPVYGANGIIGYYDEYSLDGENILIGRVGALCGNIHYVKGNVWLTNNSFSVTLKENVNVYLPYLSHVLRNLELNRLARGVAQPSVSYQMLKDVSFSLPTYEQQIELSECFEKIQLQSSELKNTMQTQIDKLKELADYSIASNCLDKRSNLKY
jgi:type I restriction enzyme M protein